MSRYTHKVDEHISYAWGYDEMLSEYFLGCFDDSRREDEDDCVFSIMTNTTTKPHPSYPTKLFYSSDEILELMSSMDFIPNEHKARILLDLPF